MWLALPCPAVTVVWRDCVKRDLYRDLRGGKTERLRERPRARLRERLRARLRAREGVCVRVCVCG